MILSMSTAVMVHNNILVIAGRQSQTQIKTTNWALTARKLESHSIDTQKYNKKYLRFHPETCVVLSSKTYTGCDEQSCRRHQMAMIMPDYNKEDDNDAQTDDNDVKKRDT